MSLINELKKRLPSVVAPVIGVCVIGYFAYHVVQGDKGMRAYQELQRRTEETLEILNDLREKRMALEHRVALLQSNSLDPDLLEERAREMANLGRANEYVIFLKN